MLTINFRRSVGALAVAVGLLAAAAPAQGFIMKDGNVCNPIRHIGC